MADAIAQGAPSATPESVQTSGNVPIPEKIKVKVDGTEEEIDLDTVKRDYQKYRSADKRFQEAASLRKAHEAEAKAIEKAKTGDFSELVKVAGDDKARAWAENYLLEFLEYQQLSPEQKENRTLKQQLADKEAAEKSFKEQQEQTQLAQLQQQAAEEIDNELSEVIKAAGVRPTPRMIARIAETMLASLVDETKPRMAAGDALKKTVSEMELELDDYLANMPVEKLIAKLPKKLRDELRRSEVDQVMSQAPQKARMKAAEDTGPIKSRKSMSTDDFFKNLERRLG